MKKWLQLLLISSLAVGLAACSDDVETTEEKAEEIEQEEIEEVEEVEEVEDEKEMVQEIKQDEEPEEEVVVEIEQEEVTELSEEEEGLTKEDVKGIIEDYALGEGDRLEDFSFENGVVYYKVSLGEHNILTPDVLAETMYSRLGDELLEHEGWDTLKVEFVDLGKTVSFDYDEHEKNEYNLKYFPSLEISERLQ